MPVKAPCMYLLTSDRLVNPYVQPVLYVRTPDDDRERAYSFPDDDPFFSEVSHLIDVIEDIEEDPEAAQILSSYEGGCEPPNHMAKQANTWCRCGKDV